MATLSQPLKRVKRKVGKCPNPLFEKWLKEWQDEAMKNGSDMQYCLKKALKSIRKFPVRLETGKECLMLENFGTKICKMLDDKLEKHKAANPPQVAPVVETEKVKSNSIIDALNIDFKPATQNGTLSNGLTRKRKNSETTPQKNEKVNGEGKFNGPKSNLGNGKGSNYVPAYRSGAYAILITLLENLKKDDYKGYMTKTEIQNSAQEFCDSSFTKPSNGSHYTAWSSMAVLIKKELIRKEGNPAKFSITEKGTDLAISLATRDSNKGAANQPKEAQSNIDTSPLQESQPVTKPSLEPPKAKDKKKNLSVPKNDAEDSNSAPSCSQEQEEDSEPEETIFLLPGGFEIKLIVDMHERDDKSQRAGEMTMRKLKARGVNFEIRHLTVGDFIWIAKDKQTGRELVLPYIIERKRLDDLASSIKDGRFHEQKHRLKQSGIQNIFYLVEKMKNENPRLGLPMSTLNLVITNLQILDEFMVTETDDHDHTMRYLDNMTSMLVKYFKDKTLMSCKKENLTPIKLTDDLMPLMTFKEFNKGSEKKKKDTIRSMLIKHLIQLQGLSIEKAQAIVGLYPTPRALMGALKRGEGEKAIAELTYGGMNRCIGPSIARKLHMLYTREHLT